MSHLYSSQVGENTSVSGGQDFDVLIFSQSWSESFCFAWKRDSPSHKCSLPRHQKWIIHGIWPTRFHEMHPSYCNQTLRSNETALSLIVDQLDQKWPNIQDGTPHFSFWEHEWEKHGTYAAALSAFNRELKYFQKGLDVFDNYDMTHILARANILPGHNYAVEKIIDGVQNILKKPVRIVCIVNPISILHPFL